MLGSQAWPKVCLKSSGSSSIGLRLLASANPLVLAVAPGPKSVDLKPVAGDLPDCAFEDREFASAAFANASLDPAECSLGACAFFEFPATKCVFEVLVVIVWPKTRKLVAQQNVDDF